jgi:hypothetical protein
MPTTRPPQESGLRKRKQRLRGLALPGRQWRTVRHKPLTELSSLVDPAETAMSISTAPHDRRHRRGTTDRRCSTHGADTANMGTAGHSNV